MVAAGSCTSNGDYSDRFRGPQSGTEAPTTLSAEEEQITSPPLPATTLAPTAISQPRIVCHQFYGGDCAWELTLPDDPGCNAQTASSEREFALLPCGYSYWIGFLETKLTTLGVRISKDGYYASDEIELIKSIQRKIGVGDDGLIGPRTWRAVFSDIDCYQFDRDSGEPSSMYDCYADVNGDGMFGPGDIIPD